MKSSILSILLLLFTANYSIAKAGPEIPIPNISAEKAIKLADEALNNDTKIPNWVFAPKDQFILISVSYTNRFDGTKSKEWAWEVKFIHPKHNDHQITYKVTNLGKVLHIGYTV